jgi:hypothetical protein
MVSGFSIVRNGERLGYPYKESILSLAPVVDEIVVAVGDSTDGTREQVALLQSLVSCPIRILDTVWDASNQKQGSELARQTNLALAACAHEVCFYLQADEVLHDEEYNALRAQLQKFEQDPEIFALAFSWRHFFANHHTVVESREWYRREIRAIKKSKGLLSYGDAQGFRIWNATSHTWTKAPTAWSSCHVHHYGWVRPPQQMVAKSQELDRLWHGNTRDGTHSEASVFTERFGMKRFRGTHPKVMEQRIHDTPEILKLQPMKLSFRRRFQLLTTQWIEALTGWRPGEFTNGKYMKRYF